MSIPIIGKRKLICVGCGSELEKVPSGLVCMDRDCARFALISVAAKDPDILEKKDVIRPNSD